MAKPKNGELNISYDRAADVLYLSLGKPRRAICETLDNGVVIRLDVRTKEIVGLTIIDFISRTADRKTKTLSTHLTASLQPV